MATIVSFRKKGSSEEFGNAYVQLDEEICRELGKECDPVRWYESWYEVIVFGFALGHSFESMRKHLGESKDEALLEVLDYLEKHYEFSTHREFGRR